MCVLEWVFNPADDKASPDVSRCCHPNIVCAGMSVHVCMCVCVKVDDFYELRLEDLSPEEELALCRDTNTEAEG